ncbi:MAG: phosphoribosyl-AMP cyclohydrolase [Clostridiaceae bacterium]
MFDIEKIDFDKGNSLVPAIVQDFNTKEVLMLAYMDKESLIRTIESGTTWFFSRSRNEYWNKGATSGNMQFVKEMYYDCDGDTILLLVEPKGPACHTGKISCFFNKIEG